MPTVYVHANTNLADEDLDDPEDVGIAGIYEVELADDTPTDGLANAALDGFHDRNAVGTLDDFEFTVRESADPRSAEIECSDAHEGYALSGYAKSVEQVSAPFFIEATFTPEAWIKDHAVEIDGKCEIDVTHAILKLAKNSLPDLHGLKDRRDSTDFLAGVHIKEVGHTGPFSVEVVEEVLNAFNVESLSDITEEMVSEAESRANPAPKSAGMRPR